MLLTIISFTTLLMTTLAPPTYTVVEDEANLPLLNTDLKERKIRKLCLANGLEILLISDPAADQSAASVCVGAGSWNDPLEYPGMAHFCEHMLFMGTQKYPNENAFFTSVSDYAGLTNAYTAPNRTVYMFSAQTTGFLHLLDQFAHFFIDPLFNQANIAREMHAVDQEFAKNIENDGWREYMIFKETGNPNHPNRMFSTGNSETLGKIPQSELKKWNQENYSAEKMHLVVYSSLSLDTLQDTVVETFSEVPQNPLEHFSDNTGDHTGNLTSEDQVGKITFISPIKNKKSLTLSWELPLALAEDDSKSADTVAYALRRGQRYSLYEKLKNEKLIDSMSTHVDELGGKTHRFFQISIELTKQGLEQMDKVILRCFEAIANLKFTKVPEYIFSEMNAMAKLNYQFQDRQDPFNYIMRLGDSIAEEPIATYPRNSILATEYNLEKIDDVLACLTPASCAISLQAPPSLTSITPDRKEKWLGAEYAIYPIPDAAIALWNSAEPNPEIHLAEPNPFIPTHLSLAEDKPFASRPIPIADDDLGIAYYVRSPEFNAPETIYHIHVLSPEINPTPKSAVLTALYIDHLTDLLHPTLAAASNAGLATQFDCSKSSLHIKLSGYSEKAPLLLQEICNQMPFDPPTPEQFALYVDRHEKAYLNAEKELAVTQAFELFQSIVNKDQTTRKEKLAALKTITYNDFLAFHQNLFHKTYIKALFAGNLTPKDAESAWLDIVHALSLNPYPKEEHCKTEVLHLPNLGPYQINQTTLAAGNAALLFIDQGGFTFEKRAIQEILSSALKESFFNELRTKQKTGYIATSDHTEIEEHLFQFFVVQSNSHQPDELLCRYEQFLEEFNDSISEIIPKARFETLKSSHMSSLKTRFRNLSDKTALWNRLAFEMNGDFSFIEKRIDAHAKLTYDTFLATAKEFFTRENRRRLAILFEGKLSSPFAYQPITLNQITEIATYEPKQIRENITQESVSITND